MALVASQAGTASWASTGTKSISVSVSAGDVLAVIVGAGDPATTVTNWTDNLGGTWTTGPSSPVSTGNLRGVTAWKVCAGGETSVSFNIGVGATGQAFAVKVTGFAGTATLEASNENEASIAGTTTSLSTNAASNSTATAVAIALFTSDRNDTVDGGGTRNYSNSFTETGFNGTSGSRAGAFAATKILSSAASQSTTFSVTDTGDEMYGAILVFGDVTGGGSIESGAGSSAGSATAAAVGASTAASTGTSTGVATVAGVGASTAASAGTSAGTSTGSAVGEDASSGATSATGAAAGSSTATGVGASIAAAAGTSAGTSTASAEGAFLAVIEAVGNAAGTSTAQAVGADASAPEAAPRLFGLSPWRDFGRTESNDERKARVRAQRERMGIVDSVAPVVEPVETSTDERRRETTRIGRRESRSTPRSESATRPVLQMAEARARRDAELKVLAALEAEKRAITREIEIRRRMALLLLAAEA